MTTSRLASLTLAVIALAAFAHADEDNCVSIGHDVVVAAGEKAEDIVCVGCSVSVVGEVAGDVVALGGRVDIQGEVSGDVVAIGGPVHLAPTAQVGGDLVALGGKIDREPGAVVSGETPSLPAIPLMGLVGLFVAALAFLVLLELLLVLIVYGVAGPRRIEVVAATLHGGAGRAFGAGVATLALFVALMALSSFLGPARPLMIVAVVSLTFVALAVGYTGLGLWFGRGLSRRAGPLGAALLGATVVAVVQLIPILGLVAGTIFGFMALGSAVRSGLGEGTDWLRQQLATT